MFSLRQRVHPTWMLTGICVGFIGGIAAARVSVLPSGVSLLCGVVLAIVAFIYRPRWMVLVAVAGGVGLGAWRGGLYVADLQIYQPLYGQTVTLRGIVAEDPVVKSGKLSLALAHVVAYSRNLPGTVHVTIADGMQVRRGDELVIRGALVPGRGDSTGAMYDASISSAGRSDNALLAGKEIFNNAVRDSLSEPAAGLGLGFLVGQKSEMPSDVTDSLKIAGLTHIVVASGYNLTILVRLCRRIFGKISRYQAAIWSILLIVGFMALTGWSASMSRAGLVAVLSVWAWYYGRRFHPITLLVFTAAVTVAVAPSYAWGDVGWLLSFAAFAGVLIVAPLLQAYFFGRDSVPFIAQLLIETIAAQLLTLPIVLGVFGQLSVVAVISNLLVVPLIPLAMLAVFATGVIHLVAPWFMAASWLTESLMGYMLGVVHWTAGLPWAQIKWQMSPLAVIGTYAVFVVACMYIWRVTKLQLRSVNIVE